MSTRRIYIVRHGEFDPKNPDISLTENGRDQAKKAGATLAELGMQGAIVLTSTATRAVQTAEEIAGQIEGSGPYSSEALWFKSMSPHTLPDLDELLSDEVAAAGETDHTRPIVAVAHAELISVLPNNHKRIAAVAFCEAVEYVPHTWVAPSQSLHR